MTPDMPTLLTCGVCGGKSLKIHSLVECVDVLRAALRERDARWLAAFDTYIKAGTELYCRHCNSILRDSADPTSCDFCRPLRALLEEAGK